MKEMLNTNVVSVADTQVMYRWDTWLKSLCRLKTDDVTIIPCSDGHLCWSNKYKCKTPFYVTDQPPPPSQVWAVKLFLLYNQPNNFHN
jgi:hypothetical protein